MFFVARALERISPASDPRPSYLPGSILKKRSDLNWLSKLTWIGFCSCATDPLFLLHLMQTETSRAHHRRPSFLCLSYPVSVFLPTPIF